jgi:hypothetical protein
VSGTRQLLVHYSLDLIYLTYIYIYIYIYIFMRKTSEKNWSWIVKLC